MEKKDVLGMLAYFDKVQEVTQKAIKLIPKNKLNFKPCPEVKSVKELVKHIYSSEKVFTEGAKKGTITEADFKKAQFEIKTVNDLLKLAKRVHQNTNRVARALTPAQMNKKVKCFWGDELPAWMCFTVSYDEHWHHRGQFFTYLRLMGVKPPDLYDFS
jgi:uncharacterized damage-inducible protein DinB